MENCQYICVELLAAAIENQSKRRELEILVTSFQFWIIWIQFS